MKWPFVRTSFYDTIVSKLIDREIRLDDEINRLNQELANEMNSRRETKEKSDTVIKILRDDIANQQTIVECLEKELQETKEQKNELSAECDRLYDEVDNLKKELEETKDALKIAQEDLENVFKFYMGKCSIVKEEILKVRGYLKTIAKKL